MSVFFNGRLWTTPATMSVVDDSAMYNKNLSVGNVLAVIGSSTGGQPNTALSFGSASEAKETLISGDLLSAIENAFDPSSETSGPTTVIGVRVNPATQSSLALKDSDAAEVISLVSTDYGLYTTGIKVKIESGTTSGKKLTTQVDDDYYVEDDVARNAFTVQYTGEEATATISTNGTLMILSAPVGTDLLTIDLTSYSTVQKVVDRISSTAGFTAEVEDGSGEEPSLNGLDYLVDQDIKTAAYTVTANLQAIVDWFNSSSEGYVTATRVAGKGTVPANIDWSYLSGGINGVVTNSEWSDAFTMLQTEDVQWVVPLSSSASIHAMADAHCAFMSNVARMERRSIVGCASGTTDDEAIALAKNINSDRTSLVHLGAYDYDDDGDLVLREPYMVAAQIAGAFSGVNPGTALTNKSLKVYGLERKLRNPTDTDALIKGGVLSLEDTTSGYRVVKSISTWLTNDNYNRVEVSCGVAVDYVARNVREALDTLRGAKGNAQTLALAVAKTESTLRELARAEPQGMGVLAGDTESPAYKGITASLEGDVMRVEFQCSPVIPVNYIPVSIFAVPYSGSASA
jgi:hypothetical protein